MPPQILALPAGLRKRIVFRSGALRLTSATLKGNPARKRGTGAFGSLHPTKKLVAKSAARAAICWSVSKPELFYTPNSTFGFSLNASF